MGGYLANGRLREVHWQAGKDRPAAASAVTVAGESLLFVDPAEIPGHADVARLGRALAGRGPRGDVYELMAQLAAHSGLRWGELAALTADQVDQAARVITVDRKVIEIGGQQYEETPKNRKRRRTIYPRRAPEGYPLAGQVAARVQAACREQEAGTNPLGLMFPTPKGRHWRASNFSRVTRHRNNIEAGLSPEDAAVRALNTSGRAVLFAGTTVCIALLGMLVLRIGYISGLGIAAAVTVLFTVAAAVTGAR
jgi:MMPL family